MYDHVIDIIEPFITCPNIIAKIAVKLCSGEFES
jgi:hypothetical protein